MAGGTDLLDGARRPAKTVLTLAGALGTGLGCRSKSQGRMSGKGARADTR